MLRTRLRTMLFTFSVKRKDFSICLRFISCSLSFVVFSVFAELPCMLDKKIGFSGRLAEAKKKKSAECYDMVKN